MRTPHVTRFLTLGVLLTLLPAGCSVGPRFHPPSPPGVTSTHPSSPQATPSLPPTETADLEWWTGFGDTNLTGLLLTASIQNHDIARAEARLREARSLWTQARFDPFPTITSESSYRNSLSSTATTPRESRDGRHNELYRSGFDATWELDLWGARRRGTEAARATLHSVASNRDDLVTRIRAEVAINYLELRGTQAQLAVARRNATNQEAILRLAEALRDGGQGTQFDVARARSLLASTRAAIPPLEAALDRSIHRIEVLCGHAPGSLSTTLQPVAPLPASTPALSANSPSELLRRRPDIRAAEHALAAATARIGIATADLFPRVTFTGSIGLEANRLSGFSASGTDTWGFGPHISWAALDLGRVRQRIRASRAQADGALATYEQTVLLALEETANAFLSLRRERERLAHLGDAERAANEAVELARQRYRDGIADFLSVLDAERTALTLQEQLVTSQTRAASLLVAAYKSLGGGWSPTTP